MSGTIQRISGIAAGWLRSPLLLAALTVLSVAFLLHHGLRGAAGLAGGLIGILLLNECLANTISRLTKIPKPHLLLALWSLWIVTLYFWIALRAFPNSQFGSNQGFCFSSVPHSYYDLLTRSLLNGHVDLGIPPSRQLAALPDPYTPSSREHGLYLYDASYHGGKYYSYFGITPVLVLLLPFFKATGLFLPGSLAAALFCGLGYLFSLLCLVELWEIRENADSPALHAAKRLRSGPLSSPSAAACTALFLGIGNFSPYMLQVPFVYETAISAGFCFSMAMAFALCRAWRNRTTESRCALWLAISGLSLGLAVGSRPSMILAGILPLVLMHRLIRTGLFSATRVLCLGLPCAAYGLLLALYNQVRFGCFYEFGRRYQLSDETHLRGNLCFEDLSSRLSNYLLLSPKLTASFPHVVPRWEWNIPPPLDSRIEGPVIGILPLLPVVVLIPLLFLPRRGSPDPFVRAFLGGLLLCFLLLLVVDASVGQNSRYLVDFLPFVLIAAAFAGFDAVSRLDGWKRRFGLPVLAVCILWTAVIVFLASHPESRKARLEETIAHFHKSADRHPDDPLLRNYLALYLSQRGDRKLSLDEYLRTVSLDPSCAEAWNNIGTQLWGGGLRKEALQSFQRAVALQPEYFDALNNLGTVLLLTGAANEALPLLEKAQEINPDSAEVHYNLAQALLRKGEANGAEAHLLRCIRIYPGYSDAHNLQASLLFSRGDYAAAGREFSTAVQLDLENSSYADNLAWFLAACPDLSLRDGKRSLELAIRVNGIEGNSRPSHLRTLAAARAECGDFPAAIRTAANAVALARTQGNPSLEQALGTDIGFYRKGTPLPPKP